MRGAGRCDLRGRLNAALPVAARSFLATIWLLGCVTPAFAQEAAETKEAWVVPYVLVILLVGLGLFVVCRPSRRDKKVEKS